jgi:hypothetical protein
MVSVYGHRRQYQIIAAAARQQRVAEISVKISLAAQK